MAGFYFDLDLLKKNKILVLRGKLGYAGNEYDASALQGMHDDRYLIDLFPRPWSFFKPLFFSGVVQGQDLCFDENKLSLFTQFFQTVNPQEEESQKKDVNLTSQFQAKLRPYQQEGLTWLCGLNQKGGILADDMGLGKTIQVLAMLSHEYTHGRKPSTLIVLPKSLLFNWKAELRKFTPFLTYVEYVNKDRNYEMLKLQSKVSNIQVSLVLTTYGVLTKDIERLKSIDWEWVILDEAHVIKNPSSVTHQAALQLKAQKRLSITGTPIENRLQDLWSQFHFLNSELFGPLAAFQQNFIEETGTEKMATSICAPYFLRRTKETVLKDLPEKVENEVMIEMELAGKKIYRNVRDQIKVDIDMAMKDGDLAKSRGAVLRGLLRLRQAALDFRLLPVAELEKQGLLLPKQTAMPDSSKLIFLMDRLRLLIEEGQSVLVFSQFTSMLDLIENELKSKKLAFFRLDGKTKDRKKVVNAFNQASASVFLLSLKAGGVGLNLTRASYVFHFDPWWNPAIEAQATDRAHRYGQKNTVFSYKLITEGTVEERVLHLQKSKKNLYDKYLSGQEKDQAVGRELVNALLS